MAFDLSDLEQTLCLGGCFSVRWLYKMGMVFVELGNGLRFNANFNQSFVELDNGLCFKGSSLSQALPTDMQYPLISAADAKLANASLSDAMVCMEGTLDEKKVKGEILTCFQCYRPHNHTLDEFQVDL